MGNIQFVKNIMTEFAESTGLSDPENPSRRYLWTDAFGVFNFLELFRQTGDENWRKSAFNLVDRVHHVLGRHRSDDPRNGWISGVSEKEGVLHPTKGGLRIGKEMKERKISEPLDQNAEWDRDGQYYHYLIKWMQALNSVSRFTKNPLFDTWARELAKTAHNAFVYTTPMGFKQMYWKMSIDLSYPLVTSMGQHDPLDGLITYHQLRATASEFAEGSGPDLHSETADMENMCRGKNWFTEDPLGIGGIMTNACRLFQLIIKGRLNNTLLLNDLLDSAFAGLNACMMNGLFELPVDYRLAFRELGLSTGLHSIEKIKNTVSKAAPEFPGAGSVNSRILLFDRYENLARQIEKFWFEQRNSNSRSWKEHGDINNVMLATSLSPGTYLEL